MTLSNHPKLNKIIRESYATSIQTFELLDADAAIFCLIGQ